MSKKFIFFLLLWLLVSTIEMDHLSPETEEDSSESSTAESEEDQEKPSKPIKKPTPPIKKPQKPLTQSYGPFGNQKGTFFSYKTSNIYNLALRGFNVFYSTSWIDCIQFYFSPEKTIRGGGDSSPFFGSMRGMHRHDYFAQGQYISQVLIKSSKYVESITFVSNRGLKYVFGDSGYHWGSHVQAVNLTSRQKIVGLFGWKGDHINALGIIVADRRHAGY